MNQIAENPFFVLGIGVDASRIEIEREANKLLGMLELDFAGAKTYLTPLGPRPRTAESVRAAVAALRDPYQRLVAEVWARHAPASKVIEVEPAAPADDTTEGARRALGWRP